MTFISKLLRAVAHCASALALGFYAGGVMTTNGTADLKLAIWLRRDRRSHPRIYGKLKSKTARRRRTNHHYRLTVAVQPVLYSVKTQNIHSGGHKTTTDAHTHTAICDLDDVITMTQAGRSVTVRNQHRNAIWLRWHGT